MRTLPLIFSDIAGSEILLILFFVLIFFGSKAIPGIAQSLGRTIRQIKDASNDVQNEIRKSAGDVKSDFNLQRMINETKDDIEKPFREHAETLDQAMNFEPPRTFSRNVTQPIVGTSAPKNAADSDTEVAADHSATTSEEPEQKEGV